MEIQITSQTIMFANTLLSNPSRDVRIDIDTPAVRISKYSRIYVDKKSKEPK